MKLLNFTLFVLIATPCLTARAADFRVVEDRFQRADAEDLGVTDGGSIKWVGFGTRTDAPNGEKSPVIQTNRLWFSSRVNGAEDTINDVGTELMGAFLDERFHAFKLDLTIEFERSLQDGDQWLGVTWNRPKIQGSAFDGDSYLLKILPDGSVQMLRGETVVAQSKAEIPMGQAVSVSVTYEAKRISVSFDGAEVLGLPNKDSSSIGSEGSYIGILSFCRGFGSPGEFERGVSSIKITDLAPAP